MGVFEDLLPLYAADPGQVPGSALAMMRLSLFDWAACGIAGQNDDVARILRDQMLTEEGAPHATLIGTGKRVPARAAALVNGATSHALDYDDTHFAHIGHPSVAVIPAALALAQSTGATGQAFLHAALIGVETSIRVGVWLGRSHYQTGFHQTATAGSFGAALAAARVLNLDPEKAAHAFGLTATRASGLKSQFGTMGKPYNAGIAASNGVEVAQLAAAGFVSRPDGIECEQGFGPTHAGSAEPLPTDSYLFETISHKFHACCHGTHAMLEALAEFGDVPAKDITSVTVTTNPRWLRVCNLPTPRTGLEAKFSYRLIAAMALSGLDTGALDTFSDDNCVQPQLVALRDKVQVTTDEGLSETQAVVSLQLANGQTRQARHDLDAPITLARREEKLRTKGRALIGDKSDALWRAVNDKTGPDLKAIASILEGTI